MEIYGCFSLLTIATVPSTLNIKILKEVRIYHPLLPTTLCEEDIGEMDVWTGSLKMLMFLLFPILPKTHFARNITCSKEGDLSYT